MSHTLCCVLLLQNTYFGGALPAVGRRPTYKKGIKICATARFLTCDNPLKGRTPKRMQGVGEE